VLVTFAALVSAAVALAAPSDLDTSFNGSGKLQIDFGGYDRATHVALAPDGKIVAVGTTANAAGNTPGEYAITRVNADGTPDSSFGSGGTVALASPTNAIGGGVVVLANNQIVVTGQGNATGDFVTKRLNADGSVDTTFGTGGTSTVDFGGTDQANAMALQPDGKLVLVGTTSTGGGDFAIARLNADGTLDTSFNGTGKRTINLGGSPDNAFAVAIQPDGKIVVAGLAGGVGDMVVTRLNANGSNDTSFAPPGDQASIGFGGSNDAANAMALQPDGKIVLVGSTDAAGAAGSAIARLNADGTLDTSFGTGGKLTPNFGGTGEAAVGVVVQHNGKIAVLSNADANHDFVVARYNPDGSADAGFGTNGHVAVDFGGDEFDGDLGLQPDGKLVLAGSTDANGSNYDMAIARLNGDPVQTTTTTGPTTPPPAPAPVASFQPTHSSVFKGGIAFTGAGSQPSGGAKLVSFRWDIRSFLNSLPVVDTDCGPQPVVGTPYNAGNKFKVTLTVFDTAGRSATTSRFVKLNELGVRSSNVHQNGVFDCENPSSGSQASTAGCAKSFGWGFLDVNSRGAADDCFQVTGNGNGFYTGKVKGPVAVNGLYVPIPKGITTDYDSNGNVSADGLSQIPIRIGPFLTQNIPLVYKVTPNKQGVYHLVNVDEAVNAPKILGSLPLRGAFSVDLIRHASQVTVGVGLPSPLSFGAKRTAQADAHLYLDNTDGLKFDGLKLMVPDVWIGPIYVKDLYFDYTKSTDTWGGGASVTLPGSSITLSGSPAVSPDFGFGLKNGRFDHAGFGIGFNPPTQPDLFPPFHTVLLSYIGASLGVNPLRITGRIGISAANIVDETGDLFAVFADAHNQYTLPENPGSELAPLANRTFDRFSLAIAGTAALKVPILGGKVPLLNAYGLYEYPDYFEFGGGFSYKVSLLKLDGNVSGFAYPSSGKFNAQGGVSACLDGVKIGYKFVSVTIHPCLQIGAVISSRGVGFCGTIGVPFPIFGTIPVVVGAGYHWGDSFPKLMIFSCDYKPYAEASPLAHTSAASGYGVNLPPKLPSAMFRVHGQGGTPDVTVTDPHGNPITASADAVTLQGSEPDTTLVALRHPTAGRWTITPTAGSVPIAGVETADGIPPVALKASVSASGTRRVLHYHLNAAEGRTVTFVEQGPDTSRMLGTARGSTGTIRFTPGPGRGGKRSIIAQVQQDGAPAENATVASYSAPRPGAPGRPGGVRAQRRHGQIAVSWRRVRGALRYEVLVKLTDGSQVFRVVRSTHVTVADPIAGRSGTVSVDALSVDATRSKAASVRIAKVVVHHKKPKKHHR
jgi:uncharacterized delta-60 repeat protein